MASPMTGAGHPPPVRYLPGLWLWSPGANLIQDQFAFAPLSMRLVLGIAQSSADVLPPQRFCALLRSSLEPSSRFPLPALPDFQLLSRSPGLLARYQLPPLRLFPL